MAAPAITATIDTAWSAISANVIALQTTYASTHGTRYFQGLRTPQTVPADGALVAPDLTLKPSYQTEAWSDFLGAVSLGSTITFSLEIHQYLTPDGRRGWVIILWVTVLGQTWMRRINVGPEIYRDLAWTAVPTPS
jgi:hypothetical protein